MFKAGLVAIVGKPNSGKSTLINRILDTKVSIATRRINTTRNQIRGIYNKPNLQIVFIDTPGFLNASSKLESQMKRTIVDSIKDVEVVLFLMPFWTDFDEEYTKKIGLFNNKDSKIFLLLTQVDRTKDKKEIFEKLSEVESYKLFDKIIPISSKTNFNIENLINLIKEELPESHPYYDIDKTITVDEQFYVSEIIREKCLLAFNQEIPHKIFVKTEKLEKKRGLIKIYSEIIIARESMKKIVIGRDGSMLKKIGTQARMDLEKFFNEKVFIDLRVKVKKDWMDNDAVLKEI